MISSNFSEIFSLTLGDRSQVVMVLQVSLHLGAVSSEPDIVVILLVTSSVVLDAALFFVGTLLDDLEDGFTTE